MGGNSYFGARGEQELLLLYRSHCPRVQDSSRSGHVYSSQNFMCKFKMNATIESLHRNQSDSSMGAVVQEAVNGNMKNEDIARLACILGRSGDFQPFRMDRTTVDLASTGGPSSLSSLLGPLYLCSMDCNVPKLGVPGRPAGGVDTLAQIPGYNIRLTWGDVLNCIEQCGYAHFLADNTHAPLDARFFAFRQKVGSQSVPELVIASILAKKIAVGLGRAGLEIRVAPHGNFGSTWEDARSNGRRFRTVAAILGIEAICVLTDATFPYQRFLGRGESLLALSHLFSGRADSYLERHATQCLSMARASADPKTFHLNASFRNAPTHFVNNLRAQGSSQDAFEEYTRRVEQNHKFDLNSDREGFFQIDLERIRDVVVQYQCLGASKESEFPDEMGLVLKRLPGDLVQRGDLLATVRISERHWLSAQGRLVEAIKVRQKMTPGRGYEEVENG